jgi:hypothetical protein
MTGEVEDKAVVGETGRLAMRLTRVGLIGTGQKT